MQFLLRDADAAHDDLAAVLAAFRSRVGLEALAGALLFSCNSRGRAMFASPDHDVAAVRGGLGIDNVAGFFAAGEIGPVGGRNHLHGFTATVLAFGTGPRAADVRRRRRSSRDEGNVRPSRGDRRPAYPRAWWCREARLRGRALVWSDRRVTGSVLALDVGGTKLAAGLVDVRRTCARAPPRPDPRHARPRGAVVGRAVAARLVLATRRLPYVARRDRLRRSDGAGRRGSCRP